MNEKKDRLEGWKEIADFLGVSEKTATRWHKQDGMPVYQHKKGKRVYASKTELLNWLERKSHKDRKQEHFSKKLVFYLAVITGLLLTIFIFSQSNYKQQILPISKKDNGKLFWKLKKIGNSLILDIYNSNDEKIKRFSFIYHGTICHNKFPKWFDIGDINGDKLEDLVFCEPENRANSTLFVYLRNKNGGLF
ncbi:helix-turn-helix transcriptional regulator [Thermotomaculum hydrothermale]|nr:helix-turn-helix domain-containing protein [Thermotomaculum hydrothermale]